MRQQLSSSVATTTESPSALCWTMRAGVGDGEEEEARVFAVKRAEPKCSGRSDALSQPNTANLKSAAIPRCRLCHNPGPCDQLAFPANEPLPPSSSTLRSQLTRNWINGSTFVYPFISAHRASLSWSASASLGAPVWGSTITIFRKERGSLAQAIRNPRNPYPLAVPRPPRPRILVAQPDTLHTH